METNDDCCAICLEKLYDGEYLFILDECNHLYHYKCINTYVSNVNTVDCVCPLCRKDFRTIGFTSIDISLLFDNEKLDENNIFRVLPRQCFVYDNLPISKKLSKFLDVPDKCMMSRFIINKKIYKYIKDNSLFDKNDEKFINCDEKLFNLFNEELIENNLNQLSYNSIQLYLCNHIGYFVQED